MTLHNLPLQSLRHARQVRSSLQLDRINDYIFADLRLNWLRLLRELVVRAEGVR